MQVLFISKLTLLSGFLFSLPCGLAHGEPGLRAQQVLHKLVRHDYTISLCSVPIASVFTGPYRPANRLEQTLTRHARSDDQ